MDLDFASYLSNKGPLFPLNQQQEKKTSPKAMESGGRS